MGMSLLGGGGSPGGLGDGMMATDPVSALSGIVAEPSSSATSGGDNEVVTTSNINFAPNQRGVSNQSLMTMAIVTGVVLIGLKMMRG